MMPEGRLTFVDIDTQRDFLEPDGPLFIPGSEAVRENLARLTAYAKTHGIRVLATACSHRLDDPDPEPFPPHCLEGTRGQERIEETAWPGSVVVSPDARFEGDEPPKHLTIQKRKYDVFTHPDAGRIFGLYGDTTFVVYGVATDYCVRRAVEGLLERGAMVVVVLDAVRAVGPKDEPAVLAELLQKGAVLSTTDEICS